MEIRTVDYMLAVGEHGSLRGAAQALGISQPAPALIATVAEIAARATP